MNIPHNFQETLAQQVRWAARNLTYNLDFLPTDKLDWKPAPTAPSALDIARHLIGALSNAEQVLRGGEWSEEEADLSGVTELGALKTQLLEAAEGLAVALDGTGAEQMERLVETPFGTMPLAIVMRFEPIDIVHHHGQITYIQQLQGDTESHFDPEAF